MTYNKVAKNETHSHCYEPLVRQCNGEPANNREVCKDWPETFCTTKYEEVATAVGDKQNNVSWVIEIPIGVPTTKVHKF